ncbi:MAG: UDP-N-acetylglucosamine--N-acetylmuramyl-(pentapeptide) pyrophosphoryl-undecaprenol N-acetylglucosamine transferase [Candidatus Paceibacterota bacterium]
MNFPFLKQNKKVRIVLTGGGSGGHTFPLIAVSREIKKISEAKNIPIEIIYIGPDDFVVPYVLKEGIMVKKILTGKFRRSFSLENFFDFFRVIAGIIQTFFYLFTIMPDLIFSKGGYGSLPIMVWGIIFFIPAYIHESDAVPGLVNHFFGRFCKKIFISFEYSKRFFPSKKTILTGNPVRENLLNYKIDKLSVKKSLGLSEERTLITFIGGSQGASNINDLVLDILPKIIDKVEIIHQTGEKNYQLVVNEADIVFREIIGSEEGKKYYHPFAFLGEEEALNIFSLRNVYLISDLIVARAGSGLIFEIALSGKPAILIPLPWATRDHQRINAYEYAKNGAAIVVEEKNLSPNIFNDLLNRVINDKEKLDSMSKAALNFALPNATKEIADNLMQSFFVN